MDILGRIPPQSIEAEKSILGAMLLDKEAISEAVQALTEEDFYRQDHAGIFKTIVELSNSNKPVDIITVSEKLTGTDIDIEYLANLASQVPTTANAKTYAAMVKGKSLRRKYILAAQEVISLAYEGNFDSIIDFKNNVQQKMDIEVKDHKQKASDIQQIGLSVMDSIEQRYKEKQENKLLYGFKWLDGKTGGAHEMELTVLAARPSIGKTAFSLQIAMNIARKKKHVAIFNLEMSKEQLTERMFCNEGKIETSKIRNPRDMDQKEWIRLSHSQAAVTELPIKIYDDIFTIESIRAKCRELKNRNKLDFALIDYLQLCETLKKCGSTNERVSHLSRQFKMLTKELNIPIWVLSQLSRANENDNRRPKLTDLRDSGAIEQDADNVLFLHDESYGKYTNTETPIMTPIELIIAKQRNGDRDVSHDVQFYKKTQRFYD